MFYTKEDRDKLNTVIDFISRLTETQTSIAANMQGVTDICKEQNEDMHQFVSMLEEIQRVRSDLNVIANSSADPAVFDAILYKVNNIEDKFSATDFGESSDVNMATKIEIMYAQISQVYRRIEQIVGIFNDQSVIERKIRRSRRTRTTGRYSHRLSSVADHRRFR